MILTVDAIEKSFGANLVLRKVDFIVNGGERVALIGANGAGKTTLFRIICGEHTADSGNIMLKKGAKIGYLSQNPDLDFNKTIYEELISTFDYLIQLEADIRALEQEMGRLAGDALDAAMSRYSNMQARFEAERGYEMESRIRGIMAGLGFDDAEHDLPIRALSGGQKTRVGLAKLLLTAPDLLLLDEPTNHLDIAAISWLEDYFVKEFAKSLVIISHDRYFMDKVATKVVEIESAVSRMYTGNYTQFMEKKIADIEIQMHHFESQQKEIARQEKSIALLLSFNREKSVRRARSKQKQLAKIERIEKPADSPDSMRLTLAPRRRSGNDVLDIRGAGKNFEGRQLFSNVNMEIKRGECVALIGPNGVGKTTLFRMIMEGGAGIAAGTNVNIGYYDQSLAGLDPQGTVFAEIANAYPRMTNLEIRNALAAFVFMGDDVFAPIANLSGGERGRVSLLKLMLGDANFLLLDEPTNHLDLPSKSVLENAINAYSGTILLISHDRYFINNTCDKIYELTPEGSALYLGDYDYFVEKKAEISRPTAPRADLTPAPKGDWAQNKAKQAEERKHKAAIARLERDIADKERQIADLTASMTLPNIYNDPFAARQVQEDKTAAEADLAQLYAQWEESHESI